MYENYSYAARLDKLDFSFNEEAVQTNDFVGFEVDFSDKIEDIELNNGDIIFHLSREGIFSPSLYNLKIEYTMKCTPPEDKHEEVSEEDVWNNKGEFLEKADLSHLSLLISNLTGAFGQTPIVTPPVFMLEKE